MAGGPDPLNPTSDLDEQEELYGATLRTKVHDPLMIGAPAHGVPAHEIRLLNLSLCCGTTKGRGTVGKSDGTETTTKPPSNGETAATARGREAHKNYGTALGDGYRVDIHLPSGKRPDAVDIANKVVRELKPDNPRAISIGQRQVETYRQELEAVYEGKWTSFVDTYRR